MNNSTSAGGNTAEKSSRRLPFAEALSPAKTMLWRGVTLTKEWYGRLSLREQGLVIASMGVGLLLLLIVVVQDSLQAFADQNKEELELQVAMKNIAVALERYTKLDGRRAAIEARYKQVEIKEGALSHLETIIKQKAGIGPGNFSIRELPAKEFGGNFEQLSFSVKFSTSDLSSLVAFLREVVYGEKPLIVGRIDVQMNRRQDALDVELDVSTIRRTREGAPV